MTVHASQLLAGRFLVEREVGRGGVGVMYRALDQVSQQTVALKIIALEGADAEESERFHREGRVLAGLHHPGIVRVVAFGRLNDGDPYIAMEWLEGEDLAQRQRRAPLSLGQCVLVAADVCNALAAAHEAGIVHRDVKPSNIFLVGSAASGASPFQVKLVDFGVAAVEDTKLTRTGAILGTPAYMAPEQARGDGKNRRSSGPLRTRRNPLRNDHRAPTARRPHTHRRPGALGYEPGAEAVGGVRRGAGAAR